MDPSLTEASRFMTVNTLLGLALSMLMHSQTIVGSGAKYTSKVQLYTHNKTKYIYYPVDISTTVFSYYCAVQHHAILHGTGVTARALGLCGILATTMCFN